MRVPHPFHGRGPRGQVLVRGVEGLIVKRVGNQEPPPANSARAAMKARDHHPHAPNSARDAMKEADHQPHAPTSARVEMRVPHPFHGRGPRGQVLVRGVEGLIVKRVGNQEPHPANFARAAMKARDHQPHAATSVIAPVPIVPASTVPAAIVPRETVHASTARAPTARAPISANKVKIAPNPSRAVQAPGQPAAHDSTAANRKARAATAPAALPAATVDDF